MLGIFASMLITITASAQTAAPDYYAGKWDVLLKGLPQGDTHMFFTITQTDGKLGGTFADPDSKKDVPLTKVEEADNKVTIYFSAGGYDVNLALEKVDDTHVKGSLMGMFDAAGERVKADAVKP